MKGLNISIKPYLEITTLEQNGTNISKVSDHLKSLEKRKKDPTAALILPGYNIITNTIFKLMNTDLPCYNLTHYRYSKSKKNIDDCAQELLGNDVSVVLKARVDKHIKLIKSFKMKEKKNNRV